MTASSPTDRQPDARPRRKSAILAIDGPELAALGGRLPQRLAAGEPATLVAALPTPPPRAIAVALFGMTLDILDLTELLAAAGYRGRVLALAPPLPNRRIVQRELASQAPTLRLRLVMLAALAPRGSGASG